MRQEGRGEASTHIFFVEFVTGERIGLGVRCGSSASCSSGSAVALLRRGAQQSKFGQHAGNKIRGLKCRDGEHTHRLLCGCLALPIGLGLCLSDDAATAAASSGLR